MDDRAKSWLRAYKLQEYKLQIQQLQAKLQRVKAENKALRQRLEGSGNVKVENFTQPSVNYPADAFACARAVIAQRETERIKLLQGEKP